jgi:hypothetical protein
MWRVCIPLAVLAVSSATASAHDIYVGTADSAGVSCCDKSDCRPARYRFTSKGLQMRVSGAWLDVPRSVVQYRALAGDTGETSGGHWCGGNLLMGDSTIITRCAFLPPNLSMAISRRH